MSRLIDADALNKELQKRVGNPDEDRLYEANLCIIDAPTIDAIPVDWLVQMRDLRRAAVAAHLDISEGSMAVLRGINVVLELWEDEKEAG